MFLARHTSINEKERSSFSAVPTQDLPPESIFLSQAGCFGGGLETCSVSAVLLPLKRLLTNDPKQELLEFLSCFCFPGQILKWV